MSAIRLHRQDAFRVSGWLTGKIGEIKDRKLSQVQAASQCSTDLKLTISSQTIANIWRDMGQDEWPRAAVPRKVLAKHVDRSRLLARNMLALHKAICQLANVDAAPEFDYAGVHAIANGVKAKEANQ